MKKVIRAILLIFLIGFLAAGIGVGGYVAYTISSADPIDPNKLYDSVSLNSYILDKDGNQVQTLHFGEDRDIVSIENIPANMKNAIIAIEDKTFYQHHGFNFKRMIGAVWNSIRGNGEISGTSTITQQLARNVYLPNIKSQRTVKRKLVEMYYAWRIENTLSKDEILEAYLNTVYFGYGAYGVGSAADTYFSKNVKDLSLTECAALAALPQAPDTYALLQNDEGDTQVAKGIYTNDASKDRRFLVLDLMAEQKYINQEDADEAKKDLEDFINPNLDKASSVNTYFCDYVISQVTKDLMETYGMEEDAAQQMVYTGGLQISSTLDTSIQNVIYNEFLNDYNFPWASETPQAAMVITDVNNGNIVAMMGGRNASGEHLFNRAVNPRQPGSSIKPLSVYSAALQKSADYAKDGKSFPFVTHDHDRQGTTGWGNYITAGSRVTDERMYFNGTVWPYNVTRRFSGRQTFRTALQQSINTCAVKIQLQVGDEYSINMLKNYGLTTVDEEGAVSDVNPAALALGAMTNGVTPLEMSLAYAAFANGGVRYEPICYTQVSDKDGKVLLESKKKGKQVLDEDVAWIMNDLLRSVVSRGIAYNAAISGVSVGGKTGTTNDQYDIWFDGFTPKYAAALWIGTDHNVQMSSMSGTAAALWSKIMSQFPNDGEYPEQPSSVVYQWGEYYTQGTQPSYQPQEATPKKKKETSTDTSLDGYTYIPSERYYIDDDDDDSGLDVNLND